MYERLRRMVLNRHHVESVQLPDSWTTRPWEEAAETYGVKNGQHFVQQCLFKWALHRVMPIEIAKVLVDDGEAAIVYALVYDKRTSERVKRLAVLVGMHFQSRANDLLNAQLSISDMTIGYLRQSYPANGDIGSANNNKYLPSVSRLGRMARNTGSFGQRVRPSDIKGYILESSAPKIGKYINLS